MSARVPGVDSTHNRLSHQVLGNKKDAPRSGPSEEASALAYLKGLAASERVGVLGLDVSEADYAAGPVGVLTLEPQVGEPLIAVRVSVFLAKADTGFEAVANDGDTLDLLVERKVDGETWSAGREPVTVTAGDLGVMQNVDLELGLVGPREQVRVSAWLSDVRGDVELPFTLVYRGATPGLVVAEIAAPDPAE